MSVSIHTPVYIDEEDDLCSRCARCGDEIPLTKQLCGDLYCKNEEIEDLLVILRDALRQGHRGMRFEVFQMDEEMSDDAREI